MIKAVIFDRTRIHKSKLGRFGGQVKEYEKGRRGYPKEVFQFLESLIKVKRPLILDVGCGTGISTRQLAKTGPVIGVDPDPIMLRVARKHRNAGVKKYVMARADRLPFKDSTFDVLTAFSAFHWFDDKKSIAEIKRVLKPGGIFFIANKPGIRSWGQGYRRAIIKSIGRPIADFVTAQNWEPKNILKNNGFQNVRVKQWKNAERYSLPRAVQYVQSVSVWNSVPKYLRARAVNGLWDYFIKIQKKFGKIERRYRVPVIVGTK